MAVLVGGGHFLDDCDLVARQLLGKGPWARGDVVEQGRSGRRPSNPAYLLNSGELPELVSPLEVLRQREGEFEGRWVASVAARKGPK